MKPRELERMLLREGWAQMTHLGKGSHRVYRHPTITGIITIAWHPSEDIPTGTLRGILKKARLK
jgi:predicted RNA binding protein YcfA (HicA-like mRNA interferase family)